MDKEYTRVWLSADGGTVARFADDHGKGEYCLRVRDLANKKEFDVSSKEPINDIHKVAVALSPDGKTAVIGNVLWDVTTGEAVLPR